MTKLKLPRLFQNLFPPAGDGEPSDPDPLILEEWDTDDDDFELGDLEPMPDVGRCCACGMAGPTVRNFIMLEKPAPVPGTGWGCLVCGLPSDGALAVVCDACLESNAEIVLVCYGYAASGDRVPMASLAPEPFDHDMSRHPEVL